jgi:hypothetical protein
VPSCFKLLLGDNNGRDYPRRDAMLISRFVSPRTALWHNRFKSYSLQQVPRD